MEELCPGPRLSTIEAWIKYLESKQNFSTNDIIQLPLHMLDEEFSEEQEAAKYNRHTRMENDIESLTKVRQVCMALYILFYFSHPFSSLLLSSAIYTVDMDTSRENNNNNVKNNNESDNCFFFLFFL